MGVYEDRALLRECRALLREYRTLCENAGLF